MKRNLQITFVSFMITATLITGASLALIIDLSSQLGRSERGTPIAGMVLQSAQNFAQAQPAKQFMQTHPKAKPYLEVAYYQLPRGLRLSGKLIKALMALF